MKKLFMFAVLATASFANCYAQDIDPEKYYIRNSLYMIKLDEAPANEEYANAYKIMNSAFDQIDFGKNYPRYNDFALSERHIDFESTPTATQAEQDAFGKSTVVEKALDDYLKQNGLKKARSEYEYAARLSKYFEKEHTAGKLIAKWYNKPGTPEDKVDFDLDQRMTIRELGMQGLSYNALGSSSAAYDAQSVESINKLISNSYVCVVRYGYVDAQEYIAVAQAVTNMVTSRLGGIGAIAQLGANAIASKIKGYFVRSNAYLFRLDWDDDKRMIIEGTADVKGIVEKPDEWQSLLTNDNFKLKYVGKSSKYAPGAMTMKAGALDKLIERGTLRATDKAFAALQRDHEEFRPMTSLEEQDGKLIAHIGMKEGIKSGDKFNVLKPVVDADGKFKEWKNVGTIKVNKGCIWDNRAGAGEKIEGEAEDKSDKDADEASKNPWTEFKEKPSKNIGVGCMIQLTK